MTAGAEVDAGPGPGTFISRFGLVRYNEHLPARYPHDGPCELGLCRVLRAGELDRALAGKAVAERRLAAIGRQARQLADRHPRLLAWRPRLDGTHRQRRRDLDACRRRRRELAAETDRLVTVILPMFEALIEQASAPPAGRAAMLVLDHCHIHGWVRGVICMACNNALISLEHGHGSVHHGAQLAALLKYLANCPDCPHPSVTGPDRG